MKILIHDPTLRDGNHAVSHTLGVENIAEYCQAVDECGLDVIEVGHGNGLGASSLQLGMAKHTDVEMLEVARANLKTAKLGVHLIPGFARLSDIETALSIGVDVLRIASHCTEASITESYIDYARAKGAYVHGVLMMTHMATPERLLDETLRLQSYGANAIVLMDSAGNYTPVDTREKVSLLAKELDIPIGFHAHNNLGLAVANSLAAVEAGATIVDGCAFGFGAGAGNTQLEVVCAVLERYGFKTDVDVLKLCQALENLLPESPLRQAPTIKTANLISGMFGVCSGFEKHVAKASSLFNVQARDVYKELACRNAVAGQEDMIIAVAASLAKKIA